MNILSWKSIVKQWVRLGDRGKNHAEISAWQMTLFSLSNSDAIDKIRVIYGYRENIAEYAAIRSTKRLCCLIVCI